MARTTLLLTILLITLTIGPISCSKCKADSQILDLWAGTTSFELPSVANNTMAYTFDSFTLPTPRAYSSTSNLQYCFALKDLETSTNNILYLDLLVLKTYQSSLVINFIY